MGLDWTAALLPAERPSWCSVTHEPVSPPSAFTLPDPTTVFLKNGNGGRVKRTAKWRWEEGEWRVLVKKDGSATRLEKHVPIATPESPTGSRISKIAAKIKESRIEVAEASASASGSNSAKTDDMYSSLEDANEDAATSTDADGWVYCDNKWEGPSGSNRMGKVSHGVAFIDFNC